MKTLKDLDFFGDDRPVLKFAVALVTINIAKLLGNLIYSFISNEGLDWPQIGFFIFLTAITVPCYFLARLVAYRTHWFPCIKNKNRVMAATFFVLCIAGVAAAIVFT